VQIYSQLLKFLIAAVAAPAGKNRRIGCISCDGTTTERKAVTNG
jgi:hypothetical protein